MKLIESKPSDYELEQLKVKYGQPKIRKMTRKDVQDIILPLDEYKDCKGEGIGLIFDRNNRFLLVKKAKDKSWFLPSGRIWMQEGIEEGTIREVYEETGLKIVLDNMPCIHIIDLHFKNNILRLWHFIFIAGTYTGQLKVSDKIEIAECGFFANSPSNNREFEREWIKLILEDI